MNRIYALIALAALAVVAPAQQTFNQALKQMKIDQKLGAQVSPDATLNDENGNRIKFASLLGKRPIILLPMFFQCKGICGKEVDSVLQIVAKTKEKVGKDYDVVLLSIHPKETSELARVKKISLLKVFDEQGAQDGFHFLTGDLPNIRKVTDSVGFGFAYDPTDDRINHPAGLMILTPAGRVSQYMFGSEYPKSVMENALVVAASEKLGKPAEVELLGCIMIDPVTGKRSLVIENVIRLIAGCTAVGIFAWIGVMTFNNRREPLGPNSTTKDGGSPTRA